MLRSFQKEEHGTNGKCGCLFLGLLLELWSCSSPFPLYTNGFTPHLWDMSGHHPWPAACNPWANGSHVIMVVPTSCFQPAQAIQGWLVPERDLPCHCAVGCVRRVEEVYTTCKEKVTSTNKPLLNGTIFIFFSWKIYKCILWNCRCLNLIYLKHKLVRKSKVSENCKQYFAFCFSFSEVTYIILSWPIPFPLSQNTLVL